MKILIIDNNMDRECWGSPDLCRFAKLSPDATIYVRRGPLGDLPKNLHEINRIIVSGSRASCRGDDPWIEQLVVWIRKALDLQIPYLGVCFGHQLLARALGGKEALREARQAEFG